MKVLITYASAGAGHQKVAEAIFDYLQANRKDLKLELVDILPYANPFFRFLYHRGYLLLVNQATWLWRFLFWFTGLKPARGICRKISIITNYLSCLDFIRFLKNENFDFIISTHFLNSELASGLKIKNKINSKLVTVITDFGVHPFWVSESTDIYAVASEFTRAELLKADVKEETIKVTGIPANPKFNSERNRQGLARKLGLDPEKFTVLLITGSFGLGPLEKIAENLNDKAQVLVVCAKNYSLYSRLEKKNLDNVKVYGFVNNTHELMAVSDVIVTKPGGSSIAELLNCGLFPIFISSIPGQEENNVKALSAYGVGIKLEKVKDIRDFIISLKENPQKAKNLKQNILAAARPFACQELAGAIR